MNATECAVIVEQLRDVYGRGVPIGDHTVAMWLKVLGNHDADDVQMAVYAWVRDRDKAPKPADLLDGVRSLQRERKYERQWQGPSACGVCENGWVEADEAGRGTVTRCPNGCLPPHPSELPPLEESEPASVEWYSKVRQARAASEVERKSMSDAAFLELRGFDPAKFRVSGGMIMARVPERKKSGAVR